MPETIVSGDKFGILTVKTSVADDIWSRLTVVRPKVEGMTRFFERNVDTVSGTTTFAVVYKISGMKVILR
jgi:hypothetical protein